MFHIAPFSRTFYVEPNPIYLLCIFNIRFFKMTTIDDIIFLKIN